MQKKADYILHHIFDWFSFNGLTLNMKKTNILKFRSNQLHNNQYQTASDNNISKEVTNIKFLGLELDNMN